MNKIEYVTEEKEDGSHWYVRIVEDDNGINKQWFGPYPTLEMRDERMERARRAENLSDRGGAPMQFLNAASDRAIINDIFGWGGLGVAALVPRR